MKRDKRRGLTLALDSGAFTIYTKVFRPREQKYASVYEARLHLDYRDYLQSPVFEKHLDRYIEFLYDHGSRFSFYATLDVIGSAKYTYEILKYMEEHGLDPMPIVHFGTDLKWFKKYIDRYEYVGIGGISGAVTKKRFLPFGRKLFDVAKNSDCKFHLYGMTNVDLLMKFPCYSADSSTWGAVGRNGRVLIPGGNNYRTIGFTERTKGDSLHYDKLPAISRRFVDGYLESLGFTKRDMALAKNRDICNLCFQSKTQVTLRERYVEELGIDHGGPYFYMAGNSAAGLRTIEIAEKLFMEAFSRGVKGIGYLATFDSVNLTERMMDTQRRLDNEGGSIARRVKTLKTRTIKQ